MQLMPMTIILKTNQTDIAVNSYDFDHVFFPLSLIICV